MYCSEACRSVSWDETHRIECHLVPILIILNFTKIELIAVRTLLMAIHKTQSLQKLLDTVLEADLLEDPKTWGLDENSLYNSADYRSVHHLVGNMELRNNADVFRKATTAAYILHLLDKKTDFFSTVGECNIPDKYLTNELKDFESVAGLNAAKLVVGGLLLKYLTIVPSNAHEISEMVVKKDCNDLKCESVEIGGALYPLLSLINHSCDPNVVRHSYNGDTVVLTAVQCIAAGDQLFDNYGYHHAMHDVQTRHSGLRYQYHFTCQCPACMEDWPVYASMPNSNPTFLNLRLKEEVEKSTEIFNEVLADIKSGRMEGKLPFLYAHLSLLHKTIKRPWKEYSECQEAIKQCLSVQANHYMAS